jgi:hypothetical protein
VTTAAVLERPAVQTTAAGSPAPGRRAVHSLLLGLAGRIADAPLAAMRTLLADDELDVLATRFAALIEPRRLALTDAEAGDVRALLAAHGLPAELADHAPRAEEPTGSPFRFAPDPAANDHATDAAIAVAVRHGGLTGLWRVARRGSTPLYLGEAENNADVVELTAETQYALAEAGRDPAVEIFTEAARLTPYHDAALAAATLVWARTEPRINLARAFDGAAGGGPSFRPDHPRLEGTDAERLLARLRAAELVLTPPGAMDDVLNPDLPNAVPLGFRSDGQWVWPDAVAYYLKRHRLAPDPGLVAHLRDTRPRPLTRVVRHQVRAALLTPSEGSPVWQAG